MIQIKITNIIESLHTSYWFLPMLMVIIAIVFSVITVRIDGIIQEKWTKPDWIQAIGIEEIRLLISTIAGSMITVTGITFSITVVALSLAASQFGSRLLRNFISDRKNQFVLGVFISNFVYCLAILFSLRRSETDVFVPHASIAFILLLTITSLGVLIFFIHHIAESIQAENIISTVSKDLEDSIDQVKSQEAENPGFHNGLRNDDDIPDDMDKKAKPISIYKTGYIQAIEYEDLLKAAQEYNCIFRLEYQLGGFVIKGNKILTSRSPESSSDNKIKK
ncbi:DUF2254 domain-containing protein [Candidatus Poribacteria bacterium]|nr:DUF2254 domain-containing protein [Candidatus Poribacteria bacterium]